VDASKPGETVGRKVASAFKEANSHIKYLNTTGAAVSVPIALDQEITEDTLDSARRQMALTPDVINRTNIAEALDLIDEDFGEPATDRPSFNEIRESFITLGRDRRGEPQQLGGRLSFAEQQFMARTSWTKFDEDTLVLSVTGPNGISQPVRSQGGEPVSIDLEKLQELKAQKSEPLTEEEVVNFIMDQF
jgi:hypothetical protein